MSVHCIYKKTVLLVLNNPVDLITLKQVRRIWLNFNWTHQLPPTPHFLLPIHPYTPYCKLGVACPVGEWESGKQDTIHVNQLPFCYRLIWSSMWLQVRVSRAVPEMLLNCFMPARTEVTASQKGGNISSHNCEFAILIEFLTGWLQYYTGNYMLYYIINTYTSNNVWFAEIYCK